MLNLSSEMLNLSSEMRCYRAETQMPSDWLVLDSLSLEDGLHAPGTQTPEERVSVTANDISEGCEEVDPECWRSCSLDSPFVPGMKYNCGMTKLR